MSSGTATIVLFVPIVLWAIVIQLWLISICSRKQKPRLAALGWIGLVVPGLFVFTLVGASRLAPPSSRWAVAHYGDEFMGRSARRYPDDNEIGVRFSLPRPTSTRWEKAVVAGLVLTALILLVVFGQTDWSGLGTICLLGEITALAALAEVELSAKRYSSRGVPSGVSEPDPAPAIH